MGAPGTTPGPWVVEDADSITPTLSVFGSESKGREWTICDMALPIDLCIAAREDVHPDVIAQQVANAHQIAASGEMYDALEDALAFVEDAISWAADSELGPLIERRERYESILARARGEKPA